MTAADVAKDAEPVGRYMRAKSTLLDRAFHSCGSCVSLLLNGTVPHSVSKLGRIAKCLAVTPSNEGSNHHLITEPPPASNPNTYEYAPGSDQTGFVLSSKEAKQAVPATFLNTHRTSVGRVCAASKPRGRKGHGEGCKLKLISFKLSGCELKLQNCRRETSHRSYADPTATAKNCLAVASPIAQHGPHPAESRAKGQ